MKMASGSRSRSRSALSSSEVSTLARNWSSESPANLRISWLSRYIAARLTLPRLIVLPRSSRRSRETASWDSRLTSKWTGVSVKPATCRTLPNRSMSYPHRTQITKSAERAMAKSASAQ
jgi:hypothetical protein